MFNVILAEYGAIELSRKRRAATGERFGAKCRGEPRRCLCLCLIEAKQILLRLSVQ